MIRTTLYDAIIAFQNADDAWAVELTRVYGRQACNARYDSTRNAATPQLAALYQRRADTQHVYDAAWAAHHSAIREAA